MYTGVSTVMNYAKKIEKKDGRTVIERIFIDEDGEAIEDPIGPLDPRLDYPNLPQVLLALKMLRRGDDVPPNTRLEYIYLETPGATHQGEKAEDYTYYKENKHITLAVPDFLHYVEKQLTNPIMELINVKYPRPKVPYEKLAVALPRVIDELDELVRFRVTQIKKYERDAPRYIPTDGTRVGWSVRGCALCKAKTYPIRCPEHTPVKTASHYFYKNKMIAQSQYILDSIAKRRENPKAYNEIDEKKYSEAATIVRRYKAKFVLDAVCASFGVRKRTERRPTQTGEKLRLMVDEEPTKVMLTSKFKTYPKNTLVSLLAIREEPLTKKKKQYFYTIKTPDDKVFEDVPRSQFTTFYYKDGYVMKDILAYRTAFKAVVKEMKSIFTPIIFNGMVEIQEEEEEEED
jgi:hypothetical protein